MAARLQEAQTLMRELATEAVERRVAHAVLRLANQAGKRESDGVRIDFPLSKQDIAEMTGTTLHTVSRIFTAWEAAGPDRGRTAEAEAPRSARTRADRRWPEAGPSVSGPFDRPAEHAEDQSPSVSTPCSIATSAGVKRRDRAADAVQTAAVNEQAHGRGASAA
jgi:hypothetical protein